MQNLQHSGISKSRAQAACGGRTGGARQGGGSPNNIKGYLWDAAQGETSADMLESHEEAECKGFLLLGLFLLHAGGAGQGGGAPDNIKGDLWDAAQGEISMDMPENYEENHEDSPALFLSATLLFRVACGVYRWRGAGGRGAR